jgi:uncharacterized protein with PIN domain
VAKKDPRKVRQRTERRELERDLRKLVRDKERLAVLEAGGSPERPLEVPTSSVIEIRAQATRCVQCDGELALQEHAVAMHGGEPLRVTHMICRRCHVKRSFWWRIAVPQLN